MACSPLTPYVVPAGVATAELRIEPPANDKEATHSALLYDDASHCREKKHVVFNLKHDSAPHITTLQANRLQTIQITRTIAVRGSKYQCGPAFSFFPETDRRYSLSVIQQGMLCRALLTDITSAVPTPVDVKQRQFHETIWSANSPACSDVVR
jgi:hypothetical protein